MRGFQEMEQSQFDSPTAAKKNLRLLMAIAANNDFELGSMDIRLPISGSICRIQQDLVPTSGFQCLARSCRGVVS